MIRAVWPVVMLVSAMVVGGADAGASTVRKIAGVVTSVADDATLEITIASPTGGRVVTARVDPRRTRIVLNGHAALVSDLHIAFEARGTLALDDVWQSITARSR